MRYHSLYTLGQATRDSIPYMHWNRQRENIVARQFGNNVVLNLFQHLI